MGEERNLESPETGDAADDPADDDLDKIVVPPTRSASVIAFGIVALTSMIFGFLLGLFFDN